MDLYPSSAIEVKLARTPEDYAGSHLTWLARKLGDELIITAGPEASRRPDGIAVVPAAVLGP